ncbi:hypothetical protein HAZT_HAZT002925 [Hyalella azteca]|uniref:DM13 domain-containing protein n=1 Tax=Hyalella azteca TaxID=294128 RepID=A0A6A0H140_HYAAZ|nr:hypothetical protein HAZT_HAZT002925 [Hyalella azteca]
MYIIRFSILDARFWVGRGDKPGSDGTVVPDENGSTNPLKRYEGKTIVITLPDHLTVFDIDYLSVWCKAFFADFGNVRIPATLNVPPSLKMLGVAPQNSGNRVVNINQQNRLSESGDSLGQQNALINFGETPDSIASITNPQLSAEINPGILTTNPVALQPNLVNTNTGANAATSSDSAALLTSITSLLPEAPHNWDAHLKTKPKSNQHNWTAASHVKSFDDNETRKEETNFSLQTKSNLNNPTPKSQNPHVDSYANTKLNCEVLYDDLALEVRWAVAGESIVMQLVGRVGGDVVTAWLERDTGRGFAEDYFLGAKAQCQGGRGSCPDTDSRGSNDVRLLNAALINDFTMLTFQRPLRATDATDRPIYTNNSQAVIWAVGPVNAQGHTSYHTLRTRGDMFVDFGRTPRWNCPLPDEPVTPTPSAAQARQPATTPVASNVPQAVTPSPNAWYIPPIPCYEPEDGVFYAQIGPTAGENGYNAITGHVGWGVAFYINGLLIPEIHVVRGKSYTFVVEGGYDEANPSRSHPLYITDDPEGGYEHKSPQERAQVKVFAGVDFDANGNPTPTSFGRLCEWKANPDQPSDAFTSFGAFQRTLNLDCKEGQPGILQWTPDANTPDTVYYQCFSHRYLGWKIHVHDTCDAAAQRSSLGTGGK